MLNKHVLCLMANDIVKQAVVVFHKNPRIIREPAAWALSGSSSLREQVDFIRRRLRQRAMCFRYRQVLCPLSPVLNFICKMIAVTR